MSGSARLASPARRRRIALVAAARYYRLASVGCEASLRVLICDDVADIGEGLALLLESQGHTAMVCHRGQDCLAKAREWKPHLVLIDLGLPDISGYTIAREIRKLDFGNDVTLVAFTAYAEPRDMRLAAQAGFDTHVKKSADPQLLVEIAAGIRPNRP